MKNEINPEEQVLNLSKNTFLEKWPSWLRWLLFLPSAVITSASGAFLYSFLTAFIGRYDSPGSIFNDITSSLLLGAIFIYVGSIVAPRYQFTVSLVLMVVLATIYGAVFFLGFVVGFEEGWFRSSVISISVIIGAIFTVLFVKEQLKQV